MHVMGVSQAAGISLTWLSDMLANRGARNLGTYEALTREAGDSPAGSRGLIWLPYLQGERTPHLDSNARGVLFGLSTAHTRRDVVRAVLEGGAFSLRDGLEVIKALGHR
jgi:xylulokinase